MAERDATAETNDGRCRVAEGGRTESGRHQEAVRGATEAAGYGSGLATGAGGADDDDGGPAGSRRSGVLRVLTAAEWFLARH